MSFTVKVKEREIRFSVLFQPIFNITENKIVAMEVLSRVAQEVNVDIESVLKEISKDGKSREFTRALISEVVSMSGLLPNDIKYLSLNMTMEDLCCEKLPIDIQELSSVLSALGTTLVVEFPENEPYPSPGTELGRVLFRNIKKLKKNGVLIAIDDYGKGFNVGDAILLDVMPDIVKVDKSIVQQQQQQKNKILWASIKSIIQNDNLKVVVEGVEDDKQLNFVRDLGVEFCQGFYLGRPHCLQ